MASDWEIAAHPAYDMLFFLFFFFSISTLVLIKSLSHLSFKNGNFLLVAPFPDHCLQAAIKLFPYIIHGADYIFRSVLCDKRGY